MIEIKHFPMKQEGKVTTKTEAIMQLNKWKESLQLPDSSIKDITFTSNALEVIYVEKEKEECRYSNQIYSTGRGADKEDRLTFSVEALGAEIEKGENPLEMHAPYSRYVLTLIQKNGNKGTITPNGNIPLTEIEDIYMNTMVADTIRAQYKIGVYQNNQMESTTKSIAYTTRFQIGNFKGKTPAQVILESPNNIPSLKNTAEWLKERIDNHASNKKQYEAVVEAISLYERNALIQNQVEISTLIPVYEAKIKAIDRKREDKKRFVYSISIMCNIAHDAPYEIVISNCFAPVHVKDNGAIQVIMEGATNKIESSIKLTALEWHTCIRKMRRYADMFEDSIVGSIFRRSSNASFRHKN